MYKFECISEIFFFNGSFLSRHLASAPSRNFQGTIYDICRGNIHPDFSATWRLHTKDEELTRFLSHIHQENINCWYFVKKTQTVPLFILISERAEWHIKYYLFLILMALLERRLFPLSALTALIAGECARRRI